MRLRNRNRIALGVAAVAVIAAGGGYATSAMVAQEATVVQACQNETNGLLRVVGDNTTDCRITERPLSWNQVGPPGPPGAAGPQGPKGDRGSSVAAHIRSGGPVTSGAPGGLVPWHLTGSSWTQKACATNVFHGKITATPSVCDFGNGSVTVQMDGKDIATVFVPNGTTGQQVSLGMSFSGTVSGGAILAAADDETHVATAVVKDNCAGAGQDVTFGSLAIDVIAVS